MNEHHLAYKTEFCSQRSHDIHSASCCALYPCDAQGNEGGPPQSRGYPAPHQLLVRPASHLFTLICRAVREDLHGLAGTLHQLMVRPASRFFNAPGPIPTSYLIYTALLRCR